MIRYPDEVKLEWDTLADEFYNSEDAKDLPEDNDIWAKAVNDYVYKHCSAKTRAFLDDVDAVLASAKKHGLKV